MSEDECCGEGDIPEQATEELCDCCNVEGNCKECAEAQKEELK